MRTQNSISRQVSFRFMMQMLCLAVMVTSLGCKPLARRGRTGSERFTSRDHLEFWGNQTQLRFLPSELSERDSLSAQGGINRGSGGLRMRVLSDHWPRLNSSADPSGTNSGLMRAQGLRRPGETYRDVLLRGLPPLPPVEPPLIAVSGAESIMSTQTSRQYQDSVTRLIERYPASMDDPRVAIGEVRNMLEEADVEDRPQGELKRSAALRFLSRIQRIRDESHFASHELTLSQTLSLVWAAVNDSEVYTTELEREDRRWGLLEAMARIQRAHNEVSASQGRGIEIQYDDAQSIDQPSCPVGAFKRLLEHLDLSHPDVRLSDVDPECLDSAGALIEVSDSQATGDLVQAHSGVFASLAESEQEAIRAAFATRGEAYVAYVRRHREESRRISPRVSDLQYQRIMTDVTFQTLLGLDDV